MIVRVVRNLALSLSIAGVLAGTPARADECRLTQVAAIPLAMAADGHLTIDATVAGQPVKLLIDTGSVFSFIDRSFVEHLGLRQIDTPILGYGLTGRPIDHVVRLGTLSLGTANIRDAAFAVSDLASSRFDASIAGVVGANYLSGYDVEIDAAGGMLKLFRQRHCPGKVVYWSHEYFRVPVHLTRGKGVEIGIDIDGRKLRALVDTGAFMTTMRLATAGDVFDLSPQSPGSTPSGRISGVDGVALDSFSHRFDRLTLGGITLENSEITIADIESGRGADAAGSTRILQEDVLIGTPLLRRLRLFIAYSEPALYFTINQPKQAAQE